LPREKQKMEKENYLTIELVPAAPPNVTVFKLAERLKVNTKILSNILERAGYVLPGTKSNFKLNEKHLKIIATSYSNSVKTLFEKTRKNSHTTSSRKKNALFNFFKLFITDSIAYDEDTIYSGKLDFKLIEDFFFSIVASLNHVFLGNISKNWLVPLKFRIIKNFIGIHKKIISTFINYHYNNFSSDEDPKSSKIICFS